MSAAEQQEIIRPMNWKVKVVNWIKTTRVQTAMVTALSLWVGYVTVKPLGIQSAILLGAIGVFVHLWGFTLNEVEDYKYDARVDDAEGHPIAKGEVHADLARYFAWMAALLALVVSVLTPYRIEATVLLLASFIPGFLYDKFSKKHWWSNVYLSVWAALMVLAGGMYAGNINIYTMGLAVAVSIQIFVQVIQGDLKDIEGPENTLAERFGVRVQTIEGNMYNLDDDGEYSDKAGDTICKVARYPRRFIWLVYGVKTIEGVILGVIAVSAFSSTEMLPTLNYDVSAIYYTVMFSVGIIFVTTVSMFLVYRYDRDEIKQKSSVHELVSILLLGIAVAPLDIYGAVLIGLGPIVWYAVVNHLVHSNALNPDI